MPLFTAQGLTKSKRNKGETPAMRMTATNLAMMTTISAHSFMHIPAQSFMYLNIPNNSLICLITQNLVCLAPHQVHDVPPHLNQVLAVPLHPHPVLGVHTVQQLLHHVGTVPGSILSQQTPSSTSSQYQLPAAPAPPNTLVCMATQVCIATQDCPRLLRTVYGYTRIQTASTAPSCCALRSVEFPFLTSS